MTTTAKQFTAVEAVPANGPGIVLGDRQNPTTLTFDNDEVYQAGFSITNTSGADFNSQIVWLAGDGGVSTFGYLWIVADSDALIELQNDNTDAVVFTLFAGVPLLLGADDMLVGTLGSDGSETSITNVIDQIRVKNNTTGASEDTTVTGRLLLFN